MSEHNVSKPRTCKTCGKVIVATAREMKEHGKYCGMLNIDARNKQGASILNPYGRIKKVA